MPREWLIQHRAGTLAEWAAAEASGPVLLAGERAHITDLNLDVVGDGVTKVASLGAVGSDTYARQAQATFRAGRRWLFAGDSITNGSTVTNFIYSYPVQALTMAGTFSASPDSIEGGTGGYFSSHLLAHLPTLLAMEPGAVHIQIGTNDTGSAVSLATYQANMAAMVGLCKAKGVPVTVGTIPPRGASSATAPIRAAIAAYNTWLRLWVPTQGAELAEVYGALADTVTGDLVSGYDSGDGVHPNDLGHQKIAQAVAGAMLRVMPSAKRGAVFTAAHGNLATNPLMLSSGSDPTGSFGLTATGTAATRSMVADTSGVLPAGQWAQVALNAAADSVQARVLPVSATGWAPGDVLAVTGHVQVTDIAGNWGQFVAAGTAEARVTVRNATTSATIKPAYDRTAGRHSGGGVYDIGPFFVPFTVPAGCLGMDVPYSLKLPTGGNVTARFGGIGIINLTALGLTADGSGMVNVDGP